MANQWKKSIKPFALTKRIDVVPVWHKKIYKRNQRTPVYIDSVNAFGTGLHETTRFMAELIEDCQGRFTSFLDVGTGSGILSMVALKSQAKEVFAIDNDKNCLPAAQTNLKANGLNFQSLKAVDLKNYNPKMSFDFVAANLYSQDLIDMKQKLFTLVKPGRYLAISGVSLTNLKKVQEAYKKLKLRSLKLKKGQKWVALFYKRQES